MSWRLVYTKAAKKGAKKLAAAGLRPKAQTLLEILAEDPYPSPTRLEKRVGDNELALGQKIFHWRNLPDAALV